MAEERSTIYQTLYDNTDDCPPITLQCGNLDALEITAIDEFLETVTDGLIGMAGGYSGTGADEALSAFALASQSRVLLIRLESSWESNAEGKRHLQNQVLSNLSFRKYGWNMPRVTTALHDNGDLRIAMAFDIQQERSNKNPPGSIAAIQVILVREGMSLDKSNAADIFNDESFDVPKLALRAWSAYKVAELPGSKSTIRRVEPIDTTSFTEEVKTCFKFLSSQPHYVRLRK